jgi:hypothetical protein
LFADKAYFHDETRRDCKERGWFLVAAYKRHRHEPEASVPALFNRFVSAMRQPPESLFNWLIQRTDLQNASRVRSRQGLLVHCYGKLAVACLCSFPTPDSHNFFKPHPVRSQKIESRPAPGATRCAGLTPFR